MPMIKRELLLEERGACKCARLFLYIKDDNLPGLHCRVGIEDAPAGVI